MREFLLGIVALAASARLSAAEPVQDMRSLCSSAGDYTFMWWTYGLRDPRKVISIQTSRYALQFDVPSMKLTHMMAQKNAAAEDAALLQRSNDIVGPSDASLICTMDAGGTGFQAEGSSSNYMDSHLIESGKYFQRRTINKIAWQKGAPKIESSLEVAAWPDRVAFLLRVKPEQAIENGALRLALTTGGEFTVAADPTDAKVARDVGKNAWVVRSAADHWPAGQERTLTLIVAPAPDPDGGRPTVTAEQIVPTKTALNVSYDRALGWHQIELRNDGNVADYAQSSNERIERVALTIDNPSAVPRTVRLNLAKGLPLKSGVFGITGLSAVLRDRDGYPTGIPIQLSKNWHAKKDASTRYQGPWYRGLTMLAIPAKTKVELEYTSVNAMWGGVPAASHAQLCLVGWGNNQLWEQSAIGSWGESICYEPDQGQVGGAVLDTRPLMVSGMGTDPKHKWGWTCNVGGADFLVYYKDGKKEWDSCMKTMHRRNGPVLTEATYAGQSHDGAIDLQYTVSIHRTDDITRGIYHFRYDVRQPTTFSRLVLFQCGGDDYSYTGERKFAYGNESGLIKEWNTQWGGGKYKTEPFEAAGRVPWFSMHEAVPRATGKEAWANRGIVIRQWDAKLGGSKASPWAAERGAKVRGTDTSLMDIMPPPSVKELKVGDYVECVVEHIIVPQFAEDYYGPNQNLRAALEKSQNTWNMILREALGNDMEIEVARGRLARRRPILIQSDGNKAEFSITGGLGYVPITVSGLSTHRGPVLEIKDGETWQVVNQGVHGKDFWQTDSDAATGTWEVTYTVPLDTPGDKRVKRQMRFALGQ